MDHYLEPLGRPKHRHLRESNNVREGFSEVAVFVFWDSDA